MSYAQQLQIMISFKDNDQGLQSGNSKVTKESVSEKLAILNRVAQAYKVSTREASQKHKTPKSLTESDHSIR